jgi:putative addiction module component (TIGR02574 family)
MSVQEIKEQALKLPMQDREWLAQELWASVEDREISPEEGAEWKRRLDDLESGRVRGIPVEETLARVEQRLREKREVHQPSRS